MGIWPILSGVLLLCCMFFIYAAATDNVKSTKCVCAANFQHICRVSFFSLSGHRFEYFWYTHHFFIFFFILLLLHGRGFLGCVATKRLQDDSCPASWPNCFFRFAQPQFLEVVRCARLIVCARATVSRAHVQEKCITSLGDTNAAQCTFAVLVFFGNVGDLTLHHYPESGHFVGIRQNRSLQERLPRRPIRLPQVPRHL